MRWAATIANFFFPGLGYIIGGPKRALGVGWLLGAFGLTYVELSIKEPLPNIYWAMFASVFLMNTVFAIDVYKEMGKLKA
ncbi:MAG: hypothetical protein AB2A00_19905 [Myxococcota bacterium]